MPDVATPKLLRRLNAGLVLNALRGTGAIRVTELVAATGLSRPTVDAVADDLVRLGWVEESDDDGERRARGRPARRLAFRAGAGHVLGLDIGEVKVRAAVADLGGEVLAEELTFVDGDGDRVALARRTATAALRAAGVARTSLLAVGVGCTGGMDPERGEVLYSGALPPGTKLGPALARSLRAPVALENDCNLAVIGERWRGVAAGVDDVICVLAGERMGAGIVVGGRLVRGHRGAAGEMAVLGAHEDEHGAEGIAYLARRMGAEAVASGAASAPARDPARAPSAAGDPSRAPSAAGDPSRAPSVAGDPSPTSRSDRDPASSAAGILERLVGGDPAHVRAEEVFAAARAGDYVAARIVDEVLHRAGRAIVPLAQVLNPELVVIGGGVAAAGETLLVPLREQLEAMAWLPPRLAVSSLAERGVVVGAIRHALDHLEPRLLAGLDQAA
jgi:predicted NBD/HSP70 family sugar kinase